MKWLTKYKTSTHTHTRTSTHTHTRIRIYTYIYTHTHTRTYSHKHILTYIHTNAHTHTNTHRAKWGGAVMRASPKQERWFFFSVVHENPTPSSIVLMVAPLVRFLSVFTLRSNNQLVCAYRSLVYYLRSYLAPTTPQIFEFNNCLAANSRRFLF